MPFKGPLQKHCAPFYQKLHLLSPVSLIAFFLTEAVLIPDGMMQPVIAAAAVVGLAATGGIGFAIHKFITRGSRTQLIHIGGGGPGRMAW